MHILYIFDSLFYILLSLNQFVNFSKHSQKFVSSLYLCAGTKVGRTLENVLEEWFCKCKNFPASGKIQTFGENVVVVIFANVRIFPQAEKIQTFGRVGLGTNILNFPRVNKYFEFPARGKFKLFM